MGYLGKEACTLNTTLLSYVIIFEE